uniref:Glycosyltransferase n=1 Tax=Oryza rufipogon TaxID=4529 RepID=A0A0E0PI84_ORYRU
MNSLDDAPKPHFVLIPFMAQGHTIPMIDMAHLLAKHGAMVSFITTPVNAARIQSTIDRARELNIPIRFVPLRLPCAEVGLLDGCENVNEILEKDQVMKMTDAYGMLHKPLVLYLQEQSVPPSCIVSDLCQPWTGDVARELGIPRLMFNGFCAFASLCRYLIHQDKVFENVPDGDELVILPGFPHHLEVSKARSPGNFNSPGFEKFRAKILDEERRADSVVTNSFYELEPSYVDSYQKMIGKRVWTIGPMFLCNTDRSTIADRGAKRHQLIKSILEEIALGLEASKRPFLWVIKSDNMPSETDKLFLPEGFEERTRGRGLIIQGWAPQALILSHPSVGGFVTHCGWNSKIEGVSAGLPMITWPHCAEQFLNEELIMNALKVGLAVGVQSITNRTMKAHEISVVKRDQIERAVVELMGDETGAEERRARAKELKEKARKAIDEGSSYNNVRQLIEYISSRGTRTDVQ